MDNDIRNEFEKGTAKPYNILPHSFPFVMLDKVLDVEKGRRGKGEKLVTCDDYPGRGDMFPQVLLLEASAQLSGIVSGREEGGYLAGMKNIHFEKNVMPGDVVEFESVMQGVFGGMYIFRVSARVGNETVMKGDIYLALA
ncbi:3-hydroxyacyl-[acyl-carrier-protein] dehydratase FabZ [bacterium BMS3Abin07]|nr:3-hydroxyacyl-[acyl-carrier-protein] dehydratase FabZ [bacterium BMS3Abin07]GBE32446.1 3-hydroxyacyl-[acyl-carrier-protein] dehydratase FabZ [bacterium BMS3Bbin05]HDL20128.1 beta-hydroxyacyl-ACP dehydratase [Nitrospirota bacterium]HDO23147.1 beta-hydroxyacyl-ACP dehydratase [Nitrospirota bacterium]HDZ87764.1 beta-hydroxyacyl-ACP dehydratase [Nitrospirota bacterium]